MRSFGNYVSTLFSIKGLQSFQARNVIYTKATEIIVARKVERDFESTLSCEYLNQKPTGGLLLFNKGRFNPPT